MTNQAVLPNIPTWIVQTMTLRPGFPRNPSLVNHQVMPVLAQSRYTHLQGNF